MTGFEVLAHVKANRHLSGIPVVMLTSSMFPDDQVRAEDLQADLFVPKPSDAEEFAAMVEALEEFWRERSG